jgi:hypothetical protein
MYPTAPRPWKRQTTATARSYLIDAMKLLDANRDQEGVSEMHLRAGTAVNEIDASAGVLTKGMGS